MRSDRYTKVVLTIVAVCLSALTLMGIGLPDFTTEAEATVAPASVPEHQDLKKPGGGAGVVRAPAATLPLRWRIPTASEVEDVNGTSCSTVVAVRNLTAGTANVQVEWITWEGNSEALRPMALPAEQLMYWATNDVVDPRPYWDDDDADITFLIGYANVHADDPRILVTATVLCRDGIAAGAKILSLNELPAHPVGATAEYFVAGTPATRTPPMVVAESPE